MCRRALPLVAALAAALASSAIACDRASFVVAIDPGHTAQNPGATSARGVAELHFNDALARRVVEALHRAGFIGAFLTRRGDASITLEERAHRAQARGARLLVSIHHDSAQPQKLAPWTYRGRRLAHADDIRGYSIFVSARNADAAGSLRLARLLGAQLRGRCLVPTLHHAEPIPGEGRELLDAQLGIYRFDDLVVLKTAAMPAVLLEAGVIVNRAEERVLRSAQFRQRVAAAVVAAAAAYCMGSEPTPPAPPARCG